MSIIIPEEKLFELPQIFTIVALDQIVVEKALHDPTSDFEDNVQLHSAAIAGCVFFLTRDKRLLSMKSFGMMRVVESLEE